MTKHFWLILALVSIGGLAAAGKVEARGGGHGGGGHGGGHHGGGHHGGGHAGGHGGHHGNHHANHNAHRGNHHRNNFHHNVHYTHHNRPFTNGWYGNHPNSWGARYPYAAGWGVAGFGATAAWLGISAADTAAGSYPVNDSTVYTGDASDAPCDSTTQTGAQDDDGDDAGDATLDAEDRALAAEATRLAQSGAGELPSDASFLPLGVYSLAPDDQDDATALVQLAVSKEGTLRGTYTDLLSDEGHPIQGAINKTTQRVAWTVAPNGKVVFETNLKDLTDESGNLVVRFENGQTRQWTLARYTEEQSKAGVDDKADDNADDKAAEDQASDAVPSEPEVTIDGALEN